MNIITANITCNWNNFITVNTVMIHAGMLYEKIKNEKPDVIGFQEVVPESLEFLKTACPDYDFYGLFRTEDFDGEGLYTAIRKDTYDVTAFEGFWLSPTPYVPGSRFPEQSTCPRVCIVTDLRNKKTGERMRIFNVHLDHISDNARKLGMECVLTFMEDYHKKNPMSVVLLGDFNAGPDTLVIDCCKRFKPIKLVELTEELPFTFHDFGTRQLKIDYIFVSEDLAKRKVRSYLWDDEKHGIYLSDHYPVGVTLQ